MGAKPLVILGAGGHAREATWLVERINQARGPTWDIVGYWAGEDSPAHPSLRKPILDGRTVSELEDRTWAVAAIGSPANRERAVEAAAAMGLPFTSLVDPSALLRTESVTIGKGTVVFANSVVTVDVRLGQHVTLNLACTVSHDSILDDFATLSPACHLSGNSRVGRGAFLGTGAVTIPGVTIGPGAVVGAGAVVVADVPAASTVVGVPARARGAK